MAAAADLWEMAPSMCHGNALGLWLASGGGVRVATGYALSDDGLWRQHSWALVDGRLVETTPCPRLRYFGFELSHAEAEEFATLCFGADAATLNARVQDALRRQAT
jgi:hypothetical protein